MRRDMDLVRAILRACAKAPDGKVQASVLVDATHSEELVAYHIDIMQQARLIQANVQRAFGGAPVHAETGPLTWEGQDFLDAVDSDTVWRQVKATLGESIKTTAFSVVKALAERLAFQALGL